MFPANASEALKDKLVAFVFFLIKHRFSFYNHGLSQ